MKVAGRAQEDVGVVTRTRWRGLAEGREEEESMATWVCECGALTRSGCCTGTAGPGGQMRKLSSVSCKIDCMQVMETPRMALLLRSPHA